ncbi:hypothetical protein [Rhodococcus sp. As11]
MTTLELFLVVVLFAENIALLVAHVTDSHTVGNDRFGEAATNSMRRRP